MIIRQCIPALAVIALLQWLGLAWIACKPPSKTVHIPVHCGRPEPPPSEPKIRRTDKGEAVLPPGYYEQLRRYAESSWERCSDWSKTPPIDLKEDGY